MEKRIRDILYPLVLLSFLATLVVPKTAFADTQTLAVESEGSQTDGTYVGLSANCTNLNSDDGNVSYLKTSITPGTYYHSYNFQDFTGDDDINSVILFVKSQNPSYPGQNAYLYTYCRIGGSNYATSVQTLTAAYVLYSGTWTLNPLTGLKWTKAQVNAAEFGMKFVTAATVPFTTWAYVVVDYTAPTAPTVTTQAVTSIAEHTATGNGNVTSDGGSVITERGTCWNIAGTPTTADFTDNVSGTTGAYTTSLAGLNTNTTYHVRAYAINAIGTSYGTEVDFTTLGNPAITTIGATSIAATTARLNARVDDDGEEECIVGFTWADETLDGVLAGWAAIAGAASGHSENVTGTWATGELPYLDITSLIASDNYTFMVRASNSVSTQYGAQLDFTAASGINAPTSFKGIPSADSISLLWVKSVGTTNTRINYKLGSYPTGTADGTNIYNGNESTYELTGLTIGTTYYFIAWGLSGTTYSADNITLLCTTSASITLSGQMPTISAPSNWFTTSDPTVFDKLPIYGTINWVWDAYQIPRATGWFLIGLALSLLGGIGVYAFSHKIIVSFFAETGFLVIFSMMGMIPLFLVFLCGIFSIGALVIGQRTG